MGLVGLWTVPAVLSVLLTYAAGAIRGTAGPVGEEMRILFGIFLPTWYFWVPGTPVVLWLTGRCSPRQPPRTRAVGVHVAAATGLGLLHAVLVTYLSLLRLSDVPFATVYVSTLVRLFPFDLFIYLAIAAIGVGVAILRESQERELRASRLESELSRARLEALHMQLHPHFLFNALNSVAMLIRTRRGAEALAAVVGFGDLLRHQLESDVDEVSLGRELHFVRNYLALEQVRFGDDLAVNYAISPDAETAAIPSLLLQPLIENAVRHGASAIEGPATIDVEAWREGDCLRVEITNDAPPDATAEGDDALATSRGGVGLSNVRRRLEARYGKDSEFSVEARDGRVVARLWIPYETARRAAVELWED